MERENYRNYDQNDRNFNSAVTEENYSDLQNLNEPSDLYLQINASDNQDLIEDKDNDPNRRTLDEYDVNDAEPDEDDSENDLLEDDSEEEE